jgi:acyl-coenzyme A synthetase/AMP-(fatty) acid ligase
MMSGLVGAILESCARTGKAIALRNATESVSYAQLASDIDRWRTLLSAEAPRARLGVMLVNRLEYVPAVLGALAAGAVPFLLDPGLNIDSQRTLARSLGFDVLLHDAAKTQWPLHDARTTRQLAPDLTLTTMSAAASSFDLSPDTVLCRFTSGTSGIPKCLEFRDTTVLAAARTWAMVHRYEPSDVILCLAAFFNGLAFNTCFFSTLLAGGTLVIYPGLPAPSQVARYALAQGATRLIAYPAYFERAGAVGVQSLAGGAMIAAYSAASRLPAEARRAFEAHHGLAIADYYGLAEAGPVTFEPHPENATGNGIVLPGCDIRTRDGVLEVRTPWMATRYLNCPGVFEARLTDDGFLRTQDRARIVDGRLNLTGRPDAVIDVGGRKFDPSDTLAALLRLPGIREAQVIGIGPPGAQEVCAAVCADHPLNLQDLRLRLADLLEPWKIPRRFAQVEDLPRNGAGKLYTSEIEKFFKKEPG